MRKTAIALTFPLTLATLVGLGVSTPASADTTTVVSVQDAHVNQASPGANYGNTSPMVLTSKTGAKKSGLVKFSLPALASNQRLVSAQLVLRPQTSSPSPVAVYRVGQSWSENTLTYRNAPSRGSWLAKSNSLTAGSPEVINVPTSYFVPGTTVAVRLETPSTSAIKIASSEAGTASARPRVQLVTETIASPPPPPPTCETDPTLCPLPPTSSWPPSGPYTQHIIGMSAPANLWDQRVSEVGADKLNSRRIFADLTSTGASQMPLIREAINDGMTPIISYKVPDVNRLIAGDYDGWIANLKSQLVALNADVTVTFWHEPHGDMTPEQFRAGSLRFFNNVDAASIAVGPILNGWLLDRRVSDFASYTDANLLSKWEFVGVDSYQEGTATNPSSTLLPARAVPKLASWLDTQGHPNKPIVLGEYNGFTGSAIQQAGEYILSTPELWIANVWNVDHTTFSVLTGDRLTAFKATKADPRTRP